MDRDNVLEALRTILVARLKFDPGRARAITIETTLPKGVEGSLGLDSLDFIELSIAIEERFGIVLDEAEDLAPHFHSVDSLAQFICKKTNGT
jgi:acyl carrier protein